ncbi:MAG: SMC-Scp complex subunit ScpB [Acidobacteriia bacterium]|nr:SMC-Scp complex subunit ScpB [Methyloceanibacter sp.]MBX5471339.1 SMC-Scp complex subunit ScpB [Acetobacteraceae bacterium]MCL6491667.1 SMC-Scp complex subunit ScpB [Terriglobia bacterium]
MASPMTENSQVSEDVLRMAEALLFAATAPISARTLGQFLPEAIEAEAVLTALRARYNGRGVELVEVAGGFQFRTAPDLAEWVRKVVETPRRLPRAAMETLAIIAYHQPLTRAEIEQIRGASLSQQTLDILLELGLIAPCGRKEVPGRPTLWGTTEAFLAHFGLRNLGELPLQEDLFLETGPFARTEPHVAAEDA